MSEDLKRLLSIDGVGLDLYKGVLYYRYEGQYGVASGYILIPEADCELRRELLDIVIDDAKKIEVIHETLKHDKRKRKHITDKIYYKVKRSAIVRDRSFGLLAVKQAFRKTYRDLPG